MCLSFLALRFCVYKKVIVLSSVDIRLRFLFKYITLDHANQRSYVIQIHATPLRSDEVKLAPNYTNCAEHRQLANGIS